MKIARETTREFFRSNAERGVDMHRPMLWGFFFKHVGASELDRVRVLLEPLGYRYVGMVGPQDGVLWLHVERVEQLSADALFQRSAELEQLGVDVDVEFDGFDVGNVDGSVLIES
jgi:hypothetical protein